MEERALETEKDYKREIEKLNDLRDKYIKEIHEIEDIINTTKNKYEKQLKILEDKRDNAIKERLRLINEAKSKGFKLRSEDVDFETRKNSILADLTNLEARKQDVLDSLEVRALETEDDYKKAYYKLFSKWQAKIDEMSKLKVPIDEGLKYEIDSDEEFLKKYPDDENADYTSKRLEKNKKKLEQLLKEKKKNESKIAAIQKQADKMKDELNDLRKEALKKGFKELTGTYGDYD